MIGGAVFRVILAIFLAWFYNRSGGNLFLMVFLHTCFNMMVNFLPTSDLGLLVLWLVVVVAIVIKDKMYRKLPAPQTLAARETAKTVPSGPGGSLRTASPNEIQGKIMKRILRSALIILPVLLLIPIAIFGVRVMLAKLAIDREWRSGPTQNFKLETTSKLEIIPLYEEASASDKFISGHGVSYLIRTDLATLLMDVGNNLEQLSLPPFAQIWTL